MSGLFGGGSYSVESVPEKQQTKSLSAGATAAAANQKEKARKTKGISASILTDRSGGMASTTSGNSTLG